MNSSSEKGRVFKERDEEDDNDEEDDEEEDDDELKAT